MNKILKHINDYKLFFIAILIAFVNNVSAQTPPSNSNSVITPTPSLPELINNGELNTRSINTDVLTNILQIAVNNGILNNNNGQYNLNSSLFGIELLFNKNLNIDSNFLRKRFERNLQLTAGIITDKNNNGITSFTPGLKIAIFNNRDMSKVSYANLITPTILKLQNLSVAFGHEVEKYIQSLRKDSKSNNKDSIQTIQKHIDKLYKNLDNFTKQKNKNPDSLLPELRKIYENYKIPIDSALKAAQNKFNDIYNKVSKKGLWTVSVGGAYSNTSWNSVNINTQYLHGLGGDKSQKDKPWDILASGEYNWNKDSTKVGNNLNRQTSSVKLGLNKVLIHSNNKDKGAKLEILGSADWAGIWNGKETNEKTSTINADFTLTYRKSDNIYVPIEITYNPTSGKFLGFLNIKWDLQTK